MAEREKFIARFEEKKQNGLVDIKFFVRPSEEGFTAEDFIVQANRIDELAEAGECRRHKEFGETFTQTDFSHALS